MPNKAILSTFKTLSANIHAAAPTFPPELIILRIHPFESIKYYESIKNLGVNISNNKDIYDDNFEYQTIYKKFKCKDTTDNYLTKIIPMIKALNNE